MKRLVMVIMTVFLSCTVCLTVADARRQGEETEALKADAIRDFEEILDLWRAGDFDGLYDRTLISGRDTKESFRKKMESASLKPSCCWEKMQSVSVSVRTQGSVVISAKLGLDAPGGLEYKTKSFKMSLEDGKWRIARSEILSLAEAKTKGSRRPKVVH
jgi:hypothetical protein